MAILDELKAKANGAADTANNIQEAVSMMEFGSGSVSPEDVSSAVAVYLDEHLTNPTNPPIDTSLTIEGAAADAKKTGDELSTIKEELTEFKDAFTSVTVADFETTMTLPGIIGTDNTWLVKGTYSSYAFYIPSGSYTKMLVNKGTNSAIIGLLKSAALVNRQVPPYCDGITERTIVRDGDPNEVIIPPDCRYIVVMKSNGSEDYTPESISFIGYGSNDSSHFDQLGLSCDVWSNEKCIFSTNYAADGVLRQGRETTTDSNLAASPFIPLKEGFKMLEIPLPIVASSEYPSFGYSLYDSHKQPLYGRCGSATVNRTTEYNAWHKIYIPKEARYFRTTYWSASFIESNGVPQFSYNLIKEIPDCYKPITHELPVDVSMQNAIRRARQLTDIKWSPRVKIPRYSMIPGTDIHFLDWFYPDKEYTGIPYSGAGKGEGSGSWTSPGEWGYAHKWVGGCVPFEAFVTAARYPNSVMGEKSEQATYNYDSSPFGVVCTALVNYSVNGPWPLRGIANFFATSDKVFRYTRKQISNTNANEIMIGDFLYTSAHVIIITDIMRDNNGNVTHVEMSEATTIGKGNNTVLGTQYGGVARRKMWEFEEFKRFYGAYTRYRRTTFYGIPYTPSKFVNTGNEGDCEDMVDLPCIPYLGNGAVYRVGYIANSKICIGATGFTSLVVTKDGEPFGTFDVTGLTEVSVGFTDAGSYEAYLTDGTSNTRPCRWTVETGTM